MEGKKYREPVEFDVIQAAIQGDADSINQIVSYFQPYINARCRRKFKDEFGHEHYITDEYMKRRLETKLMTDRYSVSRQSPRQFHKACFLCRDCLSACYLPAICFSCCSIIFQKWNRILEDKKDVRMGIL